MAELTAAETTADYCCAPEQQATCCEPSVKADCCSDGEACGCDAGITRPSSKRGSPVPSAASLRGSG
jgi:hypothetical protein